MSYIGRNMVVVGISSRSSVTNLQWLMNFISDTFSEIVSDVKYLEITNNNSLEWERKVRSCSVGILYHTKRQGRLNITNVEGALYNEELKYLSESLGRNKVLVVLDDLQNCSDSERLRILVSQPWLKDMSSELLLFSERDKIEQAYMKMGEFFKLLGNNAATGERQVNTSKSKFPLMSLVSDASSAVFSRFTSLPKLSKTVSDPTQNCSQKDTVKRHQNIQPRKSSLKVSIFSRSAESNYRWLMEWLKTTCMIRSDDVRAVYISNEFKYFYSELRNCSFAILYHTQKRGRLNVTDVTDALYNEELKELSTYLGKENVIVVMDDLQNTDPNEKNRILDNQPSIGRLARDLFLFNEKKQNIEDLEKIKQILMKVTKNHEKLDIGTWPRVPNDTTGHTHDFFLEPSKTSPHLTQNWSQKGAVKSHEEPRKSRQIVSIFSRSAQSNYDWLMDWLKNKCMMRSDDVRAVYITNKSTDLDSELQNCSFAILYHTRKQGRLNVTDVTDALYTEELKELSQHLGKENVIVVIDDLQNTDPTEKNRILDNQPSIDRLARELFLFGEKKNNSENLQKIKQILMKETQIDDSMNIDYPQSGYEPGFQRSPEWQEPEECAKRIDDKYTSTTHITEANCSYSHGLTKRDANESGGPHPKKLHLDTRSDEQVGSTLQDVLPLPLLEKVSLISVEWKECQEIMQTEFTQRSQKIETLQKENGELQRHLKEMSDTVAQKQLENLETIEKMEQRIQELQKKLKEKEYDEKQIMKEVNLTIEKLHNDLDYRDRTITENQETIQKMERNIEELQRKLQEKEDDERQSREQVKLTIEKLHNDLDYRDRTIAENQETIQKMERNIKTLQRKLQEKEDDERQSREETKDTIEKLKKEDKERTIERKDERIQKMEQTFRQLKHYITEMRTKPNQEQAGENHWKQKMQTRESQQYGLRSPISGQEDDEMICSEHRSCKSHIKHNHSLVDRSQSNSDTACQEQSQASAHTLVDRLEQIIKQKDAEIQKLQSVLKDTEILVCQILD